MKAVLVQTEGSDHHQYLRGRGEPLQLESGFTPKIQHKFLMKPSTPMTLPAVSPKENITVEVLMAMAEQMSAHVYTPFPKEVSQYSPKF